MNQKTNSLLIEIGLTSYQKTISTLMEIGLTSYEAKVLEAILHLGKAGRAVGSKEVAERAGVPRTSVYTVVDGLVRRDLVRKTTNPGPSTWTQRPWADVLSILETEARRIYSQKRALVDDLRKNVGVL